MIPEEKAELAGLLQERMLRRERWPKINVLPGRKFINGVPVTTVVITMPSLSTVPEK
jgi:hypothetical protein